MDIAIFLTKIEQLFIEDKGSSEKYIIDRLNIQRTKLIELINDLDGDVDRYFNVKRDTIKNNIRELYGEVINSIHAFLDGKFEESSNIIFERYLDPESRKRIAPLKVRHIRPNNELEENQNDNIDSLNLFRVRGNDTYNLYNKNEMFHIPFEKRGLVANQRYSTSGYPCLYLGTSVYGCWEATGRPNIDTFNIISLKTRKSLNFIDLRIPQLNNKHLLNEEWIYQLVLPLVCSLKIRNSKDSFKPEYIIPQNVLNGIIKRNYKHSDADVQWDGIMYISNIYGHKECLFNEMNKLINLIIPIKASKEKGLCDELTSQFTMTEATSILTERLTKNVNALFLYDEEEFADLYNNTMWGEIEKTILAREHSEITRFF